MRKTILLFNHNLDTCFTIKTLLERNGYDVVTVTTAENCLKKLDIFNPSLLLMESTLPREKVLKKAVKMKNLKIAYLIVDKSEMEYLKLYKNVIGFINEPTNIKNFIDKIEELLK